MKKKRNLLKRNSGFLIGCAVAAGASFFAANVLMSDEIALTAPQTEGTEDVSEAVLEPEKAVSRTYETDAFTVTASGNVIKGVEETEKSETLQTDANGNPVNTGETNTDGSSTDGNGSDSESSGGYQDGDYWAENGSGSGSSDSWSDSGSYSGDSGSGSGSYSDGSSSGNGSYSGGDSSYDQNIEITNPGNGDYSYSGDSGSSSGGSSSGGSSSGSSSGGSTNEGAWTPDDVILSGISSRYIDVSELYSYGTATLRLIRNEIFALHGRIFNSQDLMDYFSQKSWYIPTYNPEDFDANMFYYLNDYEEANLQVILDYEAWLAENY